ncbi:MAG: hypothetical protein IJM83_03575 [Firmicutes bacterium]|nr:hypothetical protein [Bacillota bacterium]
MTHEIYSYVSTRADYDPARTILVFPPEKDCTSLKAAEKFAKASGWQKLTEYAGDVLMIPILPKGYGKASLSLAGEILDEYRNAFDSLNGRSLYGRGGKLWLWETMVYLAGYQEGAVFGGNTLIAYPSRFAAAALIGGAPTDYKPGKELSAHPFLRRVSEDYAVKNGEIESCLWIFGADLKEQRHALTYFTSMGYSKKARQETFGDIAASVYTSKKNPAAKLMFSEMPVHGGIALSETVMSELFDPVIRWKNGPDGALKALPTREEYYLGSRFIQETVCVGTTDYPVSVHLPEGKTAEEVRGLPLVFSVHGRGEPARLFCTKNGWDTLADETGEFVVAFPDSLGNIWSLDRDKDVFPAMIDLLCEKYGLDRGRVYLTGFSNGASITREVGTLLPELFAGLSPWNGPVGLVGAMYQPTIQPVFLEKGLRMPYFVCIGDQDPAAKPESLTEQIDAMVKVNGLAEEADEIRTGENFYTKENGYLSGDRFSTRVWYDGRGQAMLAVTVMKNMPHGAIEEEAKASWEFLKKFRRGEDGELVC